VDHLYVAVTEAQQEVDLLFEATMEVDQQEVDLYQEAAMIIQVDLL